MGKKETCAATSNWCRSYEGQSPYTAAGLVGPGGGANFLVDLPSTGASQGLMNDGVKQRKGCVGGGGVQVKVFLGLMVEGCAQYKSGVGQRLLNDTYIDWAHGYEIQRYHFSYFL